jgi:glycosyltransferase involved in cell wall biosynthesis
VASEHTGLRKWIGQSFATLGLLHRKRPEILFVQNPSLGLTVLALLARGWFGYYLVVDAHNEGVRPFVRSGRFVRWLTARLLRGADATIVTNDALAQDVVRAGGRPLILSDRLPVPPLPDPGLETTCGMPVQVMVISTFAPDEPLNEIIAAAASLPDVAFAITGNAKKFDALRLALPPNVRLTGFLADPEYWRMLAQAQVVCDLTLMPDCLVCGAYEALAMARPMVLSDNPPTRELFGEAAVLTAIDPRSIADALRAALDQQSLMQTRAREAREAFRSRWQNQAASVWAAIRAGAAGNQSEPRRIRDA